MKNYYLMNKDRVVAEFYSQKGRFSRKDALFEIGCIYDKMPFGAEEDLTAWISDRKAAKHRVHLKKIMEELGCYDNEGFINITHIAGINDTFWAKPTDSNLTWQDVSLYCNEFTEISHNHDFFYNFPGHFPELVVDGSYPKCFRKEKQTGEYGSDIFIYKRGHKDTSFEPYCEQMASEIAKIISPENSVFYEMTMLHGKRASKCNLFTNETVGYAPYCDFVGKYGTSLDRIFEFFEKIGSEQAFTEMLLIDALCFNEDRHAGNYGVLFDTDTLEILRMSPVFDLNLSLMPEADGKSIRDAGYYFYHDVHRPKLGEDFTELGQLALENDTSGLLRKRVEQVADFSFSFRGDDVFTEERVKLVEQAVRKQAEAILSPQRLFTKDVFHSERLDAELQQKQEMKKAVEKITETRDNFMNFVEEQNLVSGDCFSSISGETAYILENMDFTLSVDFESGEIAIQDFCGQQFSLKDLKRCDSDFYEVCSDILDSLKEFSECHEIEIFSEFFSEEKPKQMDYGDF